MIDEACKAGGDAFNQVSPVCINTHGRCTKRQSQHQEGENKKRAKQASKRKQLIGDPPPCPVSRSSRRESTLRILYLDIWRREPALTGRKIDNQFAFAIERDVVRRRRSRRTLYPTLRHFEGQRFASILIMYTGHVRRKNENLPIVLVVHETIELVVDGYLHGPDGQIRMAMTAVPSADINRMTRQTVFYRIVFILAVSSRCQKLKIPPMRSRRIKKPFWNVDVDPAVVVSVSDKNPERLACYGRTISSDPDLCIGRRYHEFPLEIAASRQCYQRNNRRQPDGYLYGPTGYEPGSRGDIAHQ